jgi:hypothetical protein
MKQRMPGGPRTSLTVQAKMWPTPRAHDGTNSLGPSEFNRNSPSLEATAVTWPTPTAHDAKGSRSPDSDRQSPDLHDVVSRLAPPTPTDGADGSPKADLNPRFVAALMGVPWDWLTPCTSVETGWFRQWLHTHSCNSPHGQG